MNNPTRGLLSRTSCFLKRHIPHAGPSRLQFRLASSEVAVSHPFSQTALISPSPLAPPSNLLHPPSGASLITHLSRSSIPTSVGGLDPILFSRRHPQRIKPGSVISVVSHTTPARTNTNVFSGVLMGIRRRGVDTSITLRNIVRKTGVEMTYKIFSPLIKEIIIVKRADGSLGGLRDLHRAKLGWLRERPAMMSQIAAALKAEAAKPENDPKTRGRK